MMNPELAMDLNAEVDHQRHTMFALSGVFTLTGAMSNRGMAEAHGTNALGEIALGDQPINPTTETLPAALALVCNGDS